MQVYLAIARVVCAGLACAAGPADPRNAARATATVRRDTSDANHVIFCCRELQPPGWTYKVLLDDVVIAPGRGPVR